MPDHPAQQFIAPVEALCWAQARSLEDHWGLPATLTDIHSTVPVIALGESVPLSDPVKDLRALGGPADDDAVGALLSFEGAGARHGDDGTGPVEPCRLLLAFLIDGQVAGVIHWRTSGEMYQLTTHDLHLGLVSVALRNYVNRTTAPSGPSG